MQSCEVLIIGDLYEQLSQKRARNDLAIFDSALGMKRDWMTSKQSLKSYFSVLLLPWWSNKGVDKEDHRQDPSCLVSSLLNGQDQQTQIQHCIVTGFELNNFALIRSSLLQPLAFRKRSRQHNKIHFTASFFLCVTIIDNKLAQAYDAEVKAQITYKQ